MVHAPIGKLRRNLRESVPNHLNPFRHPPLRKAVAGKLESLYEAHVRIGKMDEKCRIRKNHLERSAIDFSRKYLERKISLAHPMRRRNGARGNRRHTESFSADVVFPDSAIQKLRNLRTARTDGDFVHAAISLFVHEPPHEKCMVHIRDAPIVQNTVRFGHHQRRNEVIDPHHAPP